MNRLHDPRRLLVHLNSLELGGTQINAVDLAVEVRRHGFESVLIGDRATIPADGPSVMDVAEARGIQVFPYDPVPSIVKRGRQLSAIADDRGLGMIHVYGSWGGGARPTYWGPSLFGRRPWLQTVYEMEVSPKLKRHMPMIVGTGYLIEELERRPGRTVLISPPVDTDSDRPDSGEASTFRAENALGGTLLVIVSRLDQSMKSLPISIAIEAMRDMGQDVTLVIVGAGDDAERLREFGKRVNEEVGRSAVRFMGAMADPRPAYAAADVVLGMGSSAARALSFGKPLVVQGEVGWSQLFDEGSAAALARSSYWSPIHVDQPVRMLQAALASVITDPHRRCQLGVFGRDFAIQRFGLPAMAAKLADFYHISAMSYTMRSWVADLPPEVAILTRKIRHRITGSGLRQSA